MFTTEQLKQAHSKVKSGADFPQYIKDIAALGVQQYETFVRDGHTEFKGTGGHQAQWEAKYAEQAIATQSDKETFVAKLKEHQQGQSDYPSFCKSCAETGIEKWIVNIPAMTCTYYNMAGQEVLVEAIPS